MSKPTPDEKRRVGKGVRRLVAQLDRFETLCAENNWPLRSVHFRNLPDAEFSELSIVHRGRRRGIKA